MSQELLRENLKGCYITIPTMFSDKNLDVDTEAIQTVSYTHLRAHET